MIRVLIPKDLEFKVFEDECKKLYENSKKQISDSNSFEFIRDNTFFYMFLDNEDKLIGGIYYFVDEDNKLFLNGFARRASHLLNLECLRLTTTWFNTDIYARAQNKASALCLLRCGFKRKNGDIFVLPAKPVS